MIPSFRAWDVHGKKMMNKLLMISYVRKKVIGKYEGGNNSYPLKIGEEAILMQSTGLFDKNGVEIYEGDVVTFEDCDDLDTDFVYVNRGVVEYFAPTFAITNRNNTEMEDLLDGNNLDVIVLGNIHENPEWAWDEGFAKEGE